jgi:hypothetical protein
MGETARMRVFLALGALLLLLFGGVVGFALGRGSAEPRWYDGYGRVSEEGHQVSVDADGWTYGFSGEIPWYDAAGTLHDKGWPECLTDDTTQVRFLAERVEVEDLGKPVLAIDCR